ncbi:hypothetical protein DSO57_1026788 [Entomophthora muscae]|uniref:Uncharacterized protein n=1 Tax=Entomophthora muscae TaxID=34485 RepID=A0ACC2T242_9FUNG|nr:hypothetical protein DSO57_1026788 [Entomophthora muscae]
MSREALAGLLHGERASEWAFTAYKDAQLVCLDLVSLSGVYCVNSIELVWDVLATLPFKNKPEMGRAHAAACFCFPVEHTISYLLENFGRAVSKLAVADATAVKKTKILLADFGLAWSANKMGVPAAMELPFAKTKHKKKISAVYNKLCKFTEAFAGQRLHLVVYLGFLFYFGIGTSVEDLDRVLLGVDKARLSLDGRKVPLDMTWLITSSRTPWSWLASSGLQPRQKSCSSILGKCLKLKCGDQNLQIDGFFDLCTFFNKKNSKKFNFFLKFDFLKNVFTSS